MQRGSAALARVVGGCSGFRGLVCRRLEERSGLQHPSSSEAPDLFRKLSTPVGLWHLDVFSVAVGCGIVGVGMLVLLALGLRWGILGIAIGGRLARVAVSGAYILGCVMMWTVGRVVDLRWSWSCFAFGPCSVPRTIAFLTERHSYCDSSPK